MLLAHYSDNQRLLRYDADSGVFDETRVELNVERQSTAFGFFADSTCGVCGVYASPAGPVLFHGARRFRLADAETKIELAQGAEENRFRLMQRGVIAAECTYKRPSSSEWGFDNWSADEDSADFFLWLSHQVGTEDFVRRFTRPIEIGDQHSCHEDGYQ